MSNRRAAVAGTWYPGTAPALAAAVDGYLAGAGGEAAGALTELVALIAPHAGLMYSGPVAAHAYGQLRGRPVGLVVLVGPSHFVGFDGVSIYRAGGFETPLGVADIDEECASAILAAAPIVHERPAAHAREHSIEMQLPFLKRVALRRGASLSHGRSPEKPSTGEHLGGHHRPQRAPRPARSVALQTRRRQSALMRLIDHISRFDAEGLSVPSTRAGPCVRRGYDVAVCETPQPRRARRGVIK